MAGSDGGGAATECVAGSDRGRAATEWVVGSFPFSIAIPIPDSKSNGKSTLDCSRSSQIDLFLFQRERMSRGFGDIYSNTIPSELYDFENGRQLRAQQGSCVEKKCPHLMSYG